MLQRVVPGLLYLPRSTRGRVIISVVMHNTTTRFNLRSADIPVVSSHVTMNIWLYIHVHVLPNLSPSPAKYRVFTITM